MGQLKHIIIYFVVILLLGCNETECSFTDYLNEKDTSLDTECVLNFKKAIDTIDVDDFLILKKKAEGYFLDKSDYSKSYPDRKNHDIYLGNNYNTFLFDFVVYTFNKIDSIVGSNTEKHLKDKTRKDLSIVYNLFLPKTEDLITIQDAKSGLKLIKKISDSHSSFSNVYPTFFIFKKDYNIPIPKPN